MRRALALGVALLALLVLGSVPHFQPQLILDRDAVFGGQAWRLLSGHFVHFGALHLVLNLLGAGLVLAWAQRSRQLGETLLFFLVGSPVIGVLLLAAGAHWYAGLSGVLHGAVALLLCSLPGRLRALGFAILLGKLAWQQWFAGSAVLHGTGIPVSLASHWIGAALGVVYFWLLRSACARGGKSAAADVETTPPTGVEWADEEDHTTQEPAALAADGIHPRGA